MEGNMSMKRKIGLEQRVRQNNVEMRKMMYINY